MSGKSKRNFGWGAGAGLVAVVGLGLGIANSGNKPAARVQGQETLLAEKEGQIMELVVAPGAEVDSGLDLVMLDDTAAQDSLRIAQDQLAKVMTETRGSGVAVALPEAPSGIGGRIVQTGPLNPGLTAPTRVPKNVKPLPHVAGTGEAAGPERDPTPDQNEIDRIKRSSSQKLADAKADEAYLIKEIENTKLEIEETERAVETSRIITDRKRLEVDKGKLLLAEGAVSQNSQILNESQLRAQEDILSKNRAKLDDANAKSTELATKLADAQKRQTEAQKEIDEAPAKATPAKIGVPTPIAGKAPSVGPRGPIVRKPAFVITTSPEASTAPAKVEIDKGAKRVGDQKLEEAQSKLQAAEQEVLERRITAPRRMRIVKWLVRPADQIKKGDAIAIIEYLPELKKAPAPAEQGSEAPVRDKPKEPETDISGSIEGKPLQNEPEIPDNNR